MCLIVVVTTGQAVGIVVVCILQIQANLLCELTTHARGHDILGLIRAERQAGQ